MNTAINWYVLYTKPRTEKKVAERLMDAGFEVYCPIVTTVRQWSDRRKKVKVPLFNSYIFIRTTEAHRTEILQTPGVVCFLFWLKKPAIVRDAEIEAIRTFTREVSGVGTEKLSFEEGDTVTIDWGLFNGQEGTYLTRQGDHLILLVESLGRVIKAEIPTAYVKTSAV